MPVKKVAILPVIVIHAGAGRKLALARKEGRARESLLRIVLGAFNLLKNESALETVVWAVTQLENDPQFNAGTGGKLQQDGVARLTAAVQDGYSGRFSGVANIEQVKNPVLVAQALQLEKDRVLAGQGAKDFARKNRHANYNPITQETFGEWKSRKKKTDHSARGIFGTVGAVAVDKKGRLAAATSTGGKGMELRGRLSDSVTVAGNYASRKAAVSATGVGEEIVESALAARIVLRVDDGKSLRRAFEKSFQELRKMKGRAGAVGVDYRGAVYVRATTECILHAIATPKKVTCYP